MDQQNHPSSDFTMENSDPIAHFDGEGFKPVEVEALLPPPEPAQPAAEVLPALIPEDQFCEMCAGLFPAIGGIQALIDPPPFAVWEDAPGYETANPAFRALYRTALRFPWLTFLVSTNYSWLGDAILIGAFAGQVAMAAMEEHRQRAVRIRGAWPPSSVNVQQGEVREPGPEIKVSGAGSNIRPVDETQVSA